MSSFTRPLKTESLPDGKHKRVLEPFRFWLEDVGSGNHIVVPAGFISDGASIPRVVWPLVGSPWMGRYVQAAILHDYLYYKNGWVGCNKCNFKLERHEVDKVFKRAMGVLSTPKYDISVIYAAVKLFGWISWNRHIKYWKKKQRHPLLTEVLKTTTFG